MKIDADYGYAVALGHLTHDFEAGRLYGLTGANGTGKSTLLATLAGEQAPVTGDVDLPPLGRVINVGDPVFLPDLTVGEHFSLIAKSTGLDVQEIVELWALQPLLEQPAFRLSSGQRQRVYLAAQIYQPCDVLLIDEPERHLDEDWTAFLVSELQHLTGDGRCVIVATHSALVREGCDEVITL